MTRSAQRVVRVAAVAAVLAAALSLVGLAAAHSGGLRNATRESLTVPTWLFLLTGGGVVGASFLLASFVTDRAFVRSLHEWRRGLEAPGRRVRAVARVAGVAALAVTLAVGFLGPSDPVRNLAILVVWVGWWGGYVATTYLVGNTWPALNPFRTIASLLPSLDRPYPSRLGSWPAVAGLLALVWVEVVTPLADDPALLAAVVAGYGALTVSGAVVFGGDDWFGSVDPVSRLVRYYGRVAPLARSGDGTPRLGLRLPGTALTEARLVSGRDEAAFVVAVLFVTTYDGFVATGLWAQTVRGATALGLSPLSVYLGAYLLGYAGFLLAFRAAVGLARRTGPTYLTVDELASRFAPPLLAIAAGYHLAHNLGTVLVLSPALLAVAASPLSPPFNPPVLAALPGWWRGLELAFVLAGHIVAVWVAHATAYRVFPGRLQAVRSQYGVTAVMVAYTMISLWIVSEPYVPPPFL